MRRSLRARALNFLFQNIQDGHSVKSLESPEIGASLEVDRDRVYQIEK